jgi:hypothetical protein
MGQRFYTEEEVGSYSTQAQPTSKRFIDITGHNYSKLKVIKFYKREDKHTYWFCECSCGNIIKASTNGLRVGSTKQCSICSSVDFSAKLSTPKEELTVDIEKTLPSKYKILSVGKKKDQHVNIHCTSCNTKLSSPYDMIMKKGYIPCRCEDSVTPFTKWTIALRIEQINSICKIKEYKLIASPTENKVTSRVTLSCTKCDTAWESSIGNFCNGGYGCPTCGRSKTEAGVRNDLEYYINKYPTEGYSYEKSLYTTCTQHIEILCHKHGSFFQSPDNHFRGGRGCPSCTKGGFNKMKGGWFYILQVNPEVLKFGITNKTTEGRKKEIENRCGSQLTILYEKFFEDGNILYSIELYIKKNMNTGVVSKEVLPSGYTETCLLEDLTSVIDIVSKA